MKKKDYAELKNEKNDDEEEVDQRLCLCFLVKLATCLSLMPLMQGLMMIWLLLYVL